MNRLKECRACSAKFDPGYNWKRAIYCSRTCAGASKKRDFAEKIRERTTLNPISGCLEWTGSLNKKGYGALYWPHGTSAHRGAWFLAFGPIPAGLGVLHKCDNRKCVNPEHLFLGTNADNTADMRAKGRDIQPKGSAHGNSKLNESVIPLIRNDTRGRRKIAADYGVSDVTISNIKRRIIWKHVT